MSDQEESYKLLL